MSKEAINLDQIEKTLKGVSLYDALKIFAKQVNLKDQVQTIDDPHHRKDKEKRLTGKQVDAMLQISSVTRHRYANDGILTRIKISPKKILYRQDEVLKLLAAKEIAA